HETSGATGGDCPGLCLSCLTAMFQLHHRRDSSHRWRIWRRVIRRSTSKCQSTINPDEMRRAGLSKGQVVTLIRDAEDGVHSEVGGLVVTPFGIPAGCVAG